MLSHKFIRVSCKDDYILSFSIGKCAMSDSELFGEFVHRSRLGC